MRRSDVGMERCGCRCEGGDMWVRREVREEEGVMS